MSANELAAAMIAALQLTGVGAVIVWLYAIRRSGVIDRVRNNLRGFISRFMDGIE